MNTQKEEEKGQHAHNHGVNCGEVVHSVYAFLDGEMKLEEVLVFKDHLKVCLPCQAYVQFEEKLINIIKSKCANDECKIPSTLMDKIRKAMDMSDSSTKV